MEKAYVLQVAPKKIQVLDNDKISIIYLYMEKNGIEILLSLIIYFLTIDIIRNDKDPKVETMDKCQHRKDWPKWKEYISSKID